MDWTLYDRRQKSLKAEGWGNPKFKDEYLENISFKSKKDLEAWIDEEITCNIGLYIWIEEGQGIHTKQWRYKIIRELDEKTFLLIYLTSSIEQHRNNVSKEEIVKLLWKHRSFINESNLAPLHGEREQYRIQYCLDSEDDIYKVVAPNVIEATGDQLAWLLKKHNQGNKNYATIARVNELFLEKVNDNTFKVAMLRNEYIESEVEDIFITGQIMLTSEAMLPE